MLLEGITSLMEISIKYAIPTMILHNQLNIKWLENQNPTMNPAMI